MNLLRKCNSGNSNFEENSFDVFIDYQNNTFSWMVALKLYHILKAYRVPPHFQNINYKGRVYLPAREGLINDEITSNEKAILDCSKFLIIICSPQTRDSRRTNEMIRLFFQSGNNNVLTLLIKGEPEDSFPGILFEHNSECINKEDNHSAGEGIEDYKIEPLAADIRSSLITDSIKRLEEDEKYRLIAPILGGKYDDLKNRHKKTIREKMLKASVVGAFLVFFFFAVGLSIWVYVQKDYNVTGDPDYYFSDIFRDKRPIYSYDEQFDLLCPILQSTININSNYLDKTRRVSWEASTAVHGIEREKYRQAVLERRTGDIYSMDSYLEDFASHFLQEAKDYRDNGEILDAVNVYNELSIYLDKLYIDSEDFIGNLILFAQCADQFDTTNCFYISAPKGQENSGNDLMNGDIILKLNEKKFDNADKLNRYLERLSEQTVTVTLLRKDEKSEFLIHTIIIPSSLILDDLRVYEI